MTPAVAAEDVWKYYGDYPALREIKLAVEPGSCVALLGRNGAGKTTLLRIIAGFSKTGKGRVSIFGKDARDTETRRRVGVHADVAEDRYRYEPVERLDPEKLFERRWAMTVLDEVLARLENEYTLKGKRDLFTRSSPLTKT